MVRIAAVLIALFACVTPALAQSPSAGSVAAEADVLAYGLPGYSGIVNVTLPSRLQVAVGIGRYTVPSFLLSGDDAYDVAKWKATVTSLQVARATYRLRGAMKSGPAVGVVALNQNWRLRSDRLTGQTTFRTLSVGITAGYYIHIGRHFYVYPTTAVTRNRVASGSTSIAGTSYEVARYAPNASLHAGWEWGR